MRKRTSIIWSISKDEFAQLVKESTSYRQILLHFGMDNKGGNGRTLKRRIEEELVDDSHIRLRSKTKNARVANSHSYDDIFTANSKVKRAVAKRYIIKHGLINHTRCSKCGRGNEWEGELLVMVLDHINGIPNDHRLENLRFLCPNCNSQTSTFAGRQLKK